MTLQELENKLVEIVLDLMKNHGINEKCIYGNIRNAIEEDSRNLPQIPVLYNDCYGGYSLSEHFARFINLENTIEEPGMCRRTKYARVIKDYGANICNMHPIIPELVSVYHMSNAEELLAHVSKISGAKQALLNIDFWVAKLVKYIEDQKKCSYLSPIQTDSNAKPTKWLLLRSAQSYSEFYIYTIESLEEFINAVDIDAMKKEYHTQLDVYYADELWTKVPQNIKESMLHFNALASRKTLPKENMKCVCFAKALEKHGQDSHMIWQSQRYYNTTCMEYLSIIRQGEPSVYSYFKENAGGVNDVVERVGLLFASGRHAKLEIAYVSQNVDWTVSEYDGIESVY